MAHKHKFPMMLTLAFIALLMFSPSAMGTSMGMALSTDTLDDDFVIEDELIVELKAADKILPIHEAQLLTYMKLANIKTGLLINFNVMLLKDGIKRFVL